MRQGKHLRKKELAAQNYRFHRGAITLGDRAKDRRSFAFYFCRDASNGDGIYGTREMPSSSTRRVYISGLMPLIVGFSNSDLERERGLL